MTRSTASSGASRIRRPRGWNVSLGNSSIIVAVIDTGYDLGHPDAPAHLVAGPPFVQSLIAAQDGCPYPLTSQDDHGHGTHVGGLIAAASNNAVGVAGLGANVTELVLKAGDCIGDFDDSDIALAIERRDIPPTARRLST